INSWSCARTNSRITSTIHVTLIIGRPVAWVANLHREAAAGIAERAPIRREIKPAISIRDDVTRRTDFEDRRARIIADRANQFAFSRAWQRRAWVSRTQAVGTDARAPGSDHSGRIDLDVIVPTQIYTGIDPV